jgi:hypothetical protein
MKIANVENPRSRQAELGQFLTVQPVADFIASIFGRLKIPIFLLRRWVTISIYSALRDR